MLLRLNDINLAGKGLVPSIFVPTINNVQYSNIKMYKNGSSKSEMGKLLGLVTVISKTPKRMKNTSLYF
jgi:hypothetical protein